METYITLTTNATALTSEAIEAQFAKDMQTPIQTAFTALRQAQMLEAESFDLAIMCRSCHNRN